MTMYITEEEKARQRRWKDISFYTKGFFAGILLGLFIGFCIGR